MGLDIRAHSEIISCGLADDYDEDLDGCKIYQGFINPHFPHAVPAPTSRQYFRYKLSDESESYHFRAGSYGGYNQFRGMLVKLFLDDSVDRVGFWDEIENHEGKPFYEMINFSDAEGIMVGPVCAKLHYDFVNHREQFVETVPDNIWRYVERYDDWTKAFDLGSRNGLVSFG